MKKRDKKFFGMTFSIILVISIFSLGFLTGNINPSKLPSNPNDATNEVTGRFISVTGMAVKYKVGENILEFRTRTEAEKILKGLPYTKIEEGSPSTAKTAPSKSKEFEVKTITDKNNKNHFFVTDGSTVMAVSDKKKGDKLANNLNHLKPTVTKTEFSTNQGIPIYKTKDGKYFDPSITKETQSGLKTETLGNGEKYLVEYDLTEEKPVPTEIDKIKVNQYQYNQIKANLKSGSTLNLQTQAQTITSKDGKTTITIEKDSTTKITKIEDKKTKTKGATLEKTYEDGRRITAVSSNDGLKSLDDLKEKDKVTYTTADKKTVEMTGKAYTDVSEKLNENTNRFLSEAISAGITDISKFDSKGNSITSGTKTVTFRNEIHEAITIEENKQLRKIIMKGGTTQEFTGNVIYDGSLSGDPFKLKAGATASTYTLDKDGNLRLSERKIVDLKDESKIRTETYNYGTSNNIEIKNIEGGEQTSKYTISMNPVNKRGDPTNGYYETSLKVGNEKIYFWNGEYYKLTGEKGKKEMTELSEAELAELKKQGVDPEKDKETVNNFREKTREDGRTMAQQTSTNFFQGARYIMTEFSGLGYFATLFLDDKALDEWRENIDKVFAELYLGTEYWTSEICAMNIERDQQGLAYVDTGNGLATVGAHIQGTRSNPIVTPKGYNGSTEEKTQYIYKITFSVKNGESDTDSRALSEMSFNVVLKGDRTVSLFKSKKTVDKGNSVSYSKSNAIVKYSSNRYDKICLKFDEVPSAWTLDDNELCNNFVEVTQGTEPYPEKSSDSSENTGSSGGSSESGAESEFNEI